MPEVVGRATKYGSSATIGRTVGWSQTYSSTSPSCTAITPTTLATSSAAPPPKPITASAAVCLERRRAGHHLARRRVAEHAVEDRHVEVREMAAELGQHRQRGERPVGDDQRAPTAGVEQVLRDEPACAGARVDGVGNEKRVMVSMVVSLSSST